MYLRPVAIPFLSLPLSVSLFFSSQEEHYVRQIMDQGDCSASLFYSILYLSSGARFLQLIFLQFNLAIRTALDYERNVQGFPGRHRALVVF